MLGEVFEFEELWVGLGLLALGTIWFALTRTGAFTETWAGYIAILISAAGTMTVGDYREEWGFLLTVLVAVACFVLHATQRSAVLVIGGSATVALAAGMAVAHWFDSGLGAMVAILIIGAVVLAVGAWLLTRSSKSA